MKFTEISQWSYRTIEADSEGGSFAKEAQENDVLLTRMWINIGALQKSGAQGFSPRKAFAVPHRYEYALGAIQ